VSMDLSTDAEASLPISHHEADALVQVGLDLEPARCAIGRRTRFEQSCRSARIHDVNCGGHTIPLM